MEFYVIAAVAAASTWVCCATVLKLALKRGWHAPVRERDVHSKPTPRLGGVAMFLGAALAAAAVFFTPKLHDVLTLERPVTGVLISISLIAVVGVLDDIYDLDWMFKLGVQIGVACILVWHGVQILSLPFGNTLVVVSPLVNLIITVLIVVTVMNAVNFIDGMDGLAAGFTLISSGFFFAYTRILESLTGRSSATVLASLIAAVTFGICLGFLPWNWYRAKLFMGDTGALILGFLLAASGISVTGQLNPGSLDQKLVLASYIPIILPLALLILPLLDMVLAVFRRLRAGRSPFRPDRQHLHHRLLDSGHSHVQVVLIFYFWTFTLALSCLLVFLLQSFLIPLLVFLGGSALCAAVTVCPLQRFRRSDKVGSG